ncbi:MAG: M4 family metallopeptidase [Lysobacter sp.]|nr:M4 family metallopeptidase [Lysobacter sp.]
MQSRLLSVAIAAALVLPVTALAAVPAGSPAVTRALGLIDGHGKSFQRADADRFVARDVIVDSDGSEHVRFDRTYRGLPVIGGDVVVHSKNGQLRSASMTLKTAGRPDVVPAVSADQAIVEAGTRFGTGFQGVPTSRLVVYARGAAPALAHEVVYSGLKADSTPTDMHYIVDAKSGQVLAQWDTVETGKPGSGGGTAGGTAAVGTGKTLFSGNVTLNTASSSGSYNLTDTTRGGGYTTNMANGTRGSGTLYTDADNIWGNNATSDSATAAADAHYGVATTWDFYKTTFGRNGIANDGKGALSRVHYSRNYVNAFWSDSCFCMTFGDGDGVTYYPLVALDVAGHEMSHGVTSRTANLTYSGESGGLNEANSDIMGTMVEFFANNANDPGDYEIGEMIYMSNPGQAKALRYMYNPNLDGSSPNCYSSGIGSLDVHYSSGVANHFYYLLAEGSGAKTWPNGNYGSPTCNGSSIAGIGRAAAQQVWYRALTVYMTSSTNYAGARAATLSAAADLYGAGSTQYATVAAAWSAVSVN